MAVRADCGEALGQPTGRKLRPVMFAEAPIKLAQGAALGHHADALRGKFEPSQLGRNAVGENMV
eukprot:1843901-Lingulodinium_polyedra.AAC.1